MSFLASSFAVPVNSQNLAFYVDISALLRDKMEALNVLLAKADEKIKKIEEILEYHKEETKNQKCKECGGPFLICSSVEVDEEDGFDEKKIMNRKDLQKEKKKWIKKKQIIINEQKKGDVCESKEEK